ncbi:putative transposase Ptta/En/Spm plant [Arabidopsis suecica]|uniref:Putative transposase Ptta/En/Spm plant n=1 Tax=Arabidopsis suecica TaxID=45249 RepID=A0A8T2DGF7_ARASU|nr:putative transposase Ptta/En/Spm plant [Arabidopsis suecica]
MRPTITISGRFYGQGSSSQAAGSERPLSQTTNVESSEQREEIAHVQYDIRVLHPSRRNGAKWFEWDASIEHLVKANFDALSAARIKGMEANNEDSSFIAVMRATHQKSDGTYVVERARLINEQYDECLLERLTQANSSNGEIVGIPKQGRVFGFGSLQSGVSMSDGSLVPPQATEEVGALTLRVKELEAELQKSREDNVLVRLEAVEQLIQTLARQNGLDASALPPPPVGSSSSPQAPMGVSPFYRAT